MTGAKRNCLLLKNLKDQGNNRFLQVQAPSSQWVPVGETWRWCKVTSIWVYTWIITWTGPETRTSSTKRQSCLFIFSSDPLTSDRRCRCFLICGGKCVILCCSLLGRRENCRFQVDESASATNNWEFHLDLRCGWVFGWFESLFYCDTFYQVHWFHLKWAQNIKCTVYQVSKAPIDVNILDQPNWSASLSSVFQFMSEHCL